MKDVLDSIASAKKLIGRPPFPETIRRVKMTCRVHPETLSYLESIAGDIGLGKALDSVVARVRPPRPGGQPAGNHS